MVAPFRMLRAGRTIRGPAYVVQATTGARGTRRSTCRKTSAESARHATRLSPELRGSAVARPGTSANLEPTAGGSGNSKRRQGRTITIDRKSCLPWASLLVTRQNIGCENMSQDGDGSYTSGHMPQ